MTGVQLVLAGVPAAYLLTMLGWALLQDRRAERAKREQR